MRAIKPCKMGEPRQNLNLRKIVELLHKYEGDCSTIHISEEQKVQVRNKL